MLLPRGRERRGREGSGARRAVPQAASNEFTLRADREDDFVVTHFGECVSIDS